MKVIFVGAGGTTRQLLRRLGEVWEAAVVDTDVELLALAGKIRDIESVEGDGSSRVVLERAGLDAADALVAATTDDERNLEACRIALEAGLLRVAAVAADPERTDRYRDLGVPAFSPSDLAARLIEGELEPRRVSSSAFAHGRAEAIEFLIGDDSPVRGKALRDLDATRYLVAAVLRDGRLIVPHGDTVISEGDLVTVVGAASDFSMIVRTFTSGEARFPVDFGKYVLVAVDSKADIGGVLQEALALSRNSNASGLMVAMRDPALQGDEVQATSAESIRSDVLAAAEGVEVVERLVAGTPSRTVAGAIEDESVGVVVIPTGSFGGWLGRAQAARHIERVRQLGVPVFLSRGSFGNGGIVTPARDTPAGRAAARAAIDLAVYTRQSLTGVAVVAPAFLAGGDSKEAAQRAMLRLREEAAVLGVRVRRRVRQ
ncbi:MAG: NAD-binding protein, partial [Acidimicrobiia bacterium]|nr:NAD-binding protein [Acidimicrobiia bacterium]